MLIGMIGSISLRSLGYAWIGFGNFNRIVSELPATIVMFCLISFFAYIYEQKVKNLILAVCCTISVLQVSFFLYFTFVAKIPLESRLTDVWGLNYPVIIFRSSILVIVFIILTRILRRINLKYDESNLYFIRLKSWALALFVITCIAIIFNILKDLKNPLNSIGEVGIMVCHFAGVLLILFRPSFINRTKLNISLNESFTKKESSDINENEFHKVFFANVYFLQKESSLEDLSKKLNTTPKQVSVYIHSHYGSNYTDLMNRFRIEYFIDLLNSGKYLDYTIDSLAQMSGFSSRHHLYLSFKKFHGGTPSEYIRSLEK